MAKYNFQDDVLPLKNELFRLALRITLSQEEAEDVVQETMAKVWNKRETWNTIDSMEAFCLTVCRNLALDREKRKNLRERTLGFSAEADAADTSYSADPEQRTVDSDRMRLLKRLIDSLPEKQRSVMHLRDVEGKSYREIASIMQITEEQVKVNLFRARQKIKKKFIETDSYGL